MGGARQGDTEQGPRPGQTCPGPRATPQSPSLPPHCPPTLQGAGPGRKDTATLWESLNMVEMADKFGQKLRRNSKQGVPSRPSSP